VTIIITGMDLP